MIRVFDILLSSVGLLILIPLLFPIIIILRFTGESEVFYKQKRIGLNRKKFYILKFATMKKNSPNVGTKTITVGDDPRILPFGKFLRKTKINELPQIFNILIGHMSVIGPRPLTEQGFKNYEADIQKKIIKLKPGLSGIGSLIFFNEEELLRQNKNPVYMWKNIISPYKGELETWYFKNINLMNYFLLIILTFLTLVLPIKINIFNVFKTLPKPPSKLKKFKDFKFNYVD